MSDFIIKHSKAIIAVWIVVLICSVPFAIKSGDVLEYDMTQMSGADTESVEGQKILDENFTNSIDLSEILVMQYTSAAELATVQQVYAKFAELMNDKYGDKIGVSNYGTFSKADPTVSGIDLVAIAVNEDGFDISDETGEIRGLVSQAKAAVTGGSSIVSYVTGNSAISYDTEKSSLEDVSKVDPLSILLIFVLLGLFFYALVTAFVPPAVVGMAYVIVLMLMYMIGSVLNIFYITQVLILVSMLGAGCDYAIFIITRYRDECKKGKGHEEALKEAIMWGGEAVFTSGVSVIIGFAALALCSFSLVQTMGIILALGILVALVAALTFIPALLNVVKDRIFWPSNIESYKKNDEVADGNGKKTIHSRLTRFSRRYFGWLSRFTEKRAAAIAVVILVAAVPSIYMFATSEDSADMISVMPPSESVDGLNLIMTQTSGGTIMPTYVVFELDSPIATVDTVNMLGNELPYVIWNDVGKSAVPAFMGISQEITSKYDIVDSANGLNSWATLYLVASSTVQTTEPTIVNQAILSQVPTAVSGGIATVLAMASGQSPMTPGFPDVTKLTATPDTVLSGPLTVANIIDGILNYSTGILDKSAKHVSMMVITAEEPMSDNTMDFIDELKHYFHDEGGLDDKYEAIWDASYISGTAAVMNDISGEVESQFGMIRIVVAILLVVLLFFILGSYVTPIRAILTILLSVVITVALTRLLFSTILDTPVLFLIPIVLFVVLLGLGMDYEIFLTTKIRENRIKGMDNHLAISSAIKEAGPVISLCALLMGGTFLTLTLAGSSMLKEFGFALGVGILLDGLVMVGFVSPAFMHLLGNWSWKGPGFLTKRHGLNPDGTNMAAESSVEKSEDGSDQESA